MTARRALVGVLIALASACGSETDRSPGAVALVLRVSPQATVDVVAYTITSPSGAVAAAGNIAVEAPGATASFTVGGLAAGSGYRVELAATSTDGRTTCAGGAPFDVIAGQVTLVQVELACRARDDSGGVVVSGTVNNCPSIHSLVVAPLATAVNGQIAVAVTASDLDAGDTVAVSWSATAGAFVAAGARTTTYACTAPGAQTLTVTASDGRCSSSASVPITCVTWSCGNGQVEAGEECDGTPRCNTECIIVPVCGDAIREKQEQCDPPNGTTCDPQCRGVGMLSCGNGIVQPGEECDPPSDTCTQACQVRRPLCGDGIVNQPFEHCDPGPISSPTCNSDCTRAPSACSVCLSSRCDPTKGCTPLTGDDRLSCQAVESCSYRTGCVTPTGDATSCYCGTASVLDCLAGAGNGPCRPEFERAARSTDPTLVSERFADPSFPSGRAHAAITCAATECENVCPEPSVGCGNGVVEPALGESCDPPNGTTCGPDCRPLLRRCGDSRVDASLGEQCDPPDGWTCSSSCRSITCGDGRVEGPEQCDPPNTTVCAANCRVPCGDGIVEPTRGEECDPPAPRSCTNSCKRYQPTCGNNILDVGEECDPPDQARYCAADCRITSRCDRCIVEKCGVELANCAGLPPAKAPLCNAALMCMRTTGCPRNGDSQTCYCGSASDSDCLAGLGDGVCRSSLEAAAESSVPLDVAERFVNPDWAIGRAVNRIACEQLCVVECADRL